MAQILISVYLRTLLSLRVVLLTFPGEILLTLLLRSSLLLTSLLQNQKCRIARSMMKNSAICTPRNVHLATYPRQSLWLCSSAHLAQIWGCGACIYLSILIFHQRGNTTSVVFLPRLYRRWCIPPWMHRFPQCYYA